MFIRLGLAYCYAVLPYLCLFSAFVFSSRNIRSLANKFFMSVVAGTAAFCVTASTITRFSFDLYQEVHVVLLFVGVFSIISRKAKIFGTPHTLEINKHYVYILILLVTAFLVRFVPSFLGNESMGGDDARFHNILAQKILLERTLSVDWTPFAPVNVIYPQGSHVLTAFIACIANCPVHYAFNFLIIVAGVLTAGMIYLIADQIFHSSKCAFYAAASYAFLPYWGSLDYYRWGGLPNSIGMLFLCLLVLIVLGKAHSEQSKRNIAVIGSALCVLAVYSVHHYSFLITIIFLVAGAIFTADTHYRRMLMAVAGLGILFCLPILAPNYLASAVFRETASALIFREPFISISSAVNYLNPIFVTVFVLAILETMGSSFNAPQLLVLCWFTSMLACFVFLEYLFRAGVLLVTHVTGFYTCLTPSRMLTNLVYPMSVLCGSIPLSDIWTRHKNTCIAIFFLFAITACAVTWRNQVYTGVFPEEKECAEWIKSNTPQNSMIIGNLPHLEYLAWRETSNPPLPASERRNDPSVVWKKQIQTYDEWLKWGGKNKRPVYFLLSANEAKPDLLKKVFSNSKVSIMVSAE